MKIDLSFESIADLQKFIKDFDRMFGSSGWQDVKPVESPFRQQTLPVTPVTPVAPVTPVVPVAPVAPAPAPVTPVAPAPVQVTAPSYTKEELLRAAASLRTLGKVNELIALNSQFGLKCLTDILPEQFGAYATALRGLGVSI